MRRLFQYALALCLVVLVACSQGSPGAVELSVPVTGIPSSNPGIQVLSPAPSGLFEGAFRVAITNFDYVPELATNAREEFANGFVEPGRGHVHGWIFDSRGEQVRFYGAGGSEYVGNVYIKTDDFEPGSYTAYFALQNHDHTPTIQASAPAFPPIASVAFMVE
jgi:hypothetical protein